MSIGGRLDYARLAQLHRPTDAPSMRSAVLDLDAQGLTPADIAAALRLSIPAVSALLTAPVKVNDAAAIHAAAWRADFPSIPSADHAGSAGTGEHR